MPQDGQTHFQNLAATLRIKGLKREGKNTKIEQGHLYYLETAE